MMKQTLSCTLPIGAHPWSAMRRVLLGAGLLALAALTLGQAQAQTGGDFPPVRLGLADTSPNTGNSFDNFGVPYDRVFSQPPFTEPAAPYGDIIHFPNLAIDPIAKFGQNGRIEASLFDLSTDINASTPLRRGYAPPDAKLKLGPLFIDWSRLTFTLLATDNEYQTHDHRRAGAISIASMDFSLHLQISEGLYIATSGSVVYLPFKNAIGLNGFGMSDPFSFTVGGRMQGPSRASIVDHMTLGGWDIDLQVYGEATTYYREINYRFENADTLWNDRQFNEQDVAGNYAFGSSGVGSGNNGYQRVDGFEDVRYTGNSNNWRIGTLVHVGRDIPMGSSLHLTVSATRLDSITEDTNHRLYQQTQESYSVQFTDERIQTRFKPFAIYTVSRAYDNRAPDDDRHLWNHVARVGFAGPASENISLYADYGYAFRTYDLDYLRHTHSEVYRAGILHDINPYMAHGLSVERSVGSNFDINDSINYNHRIILGPHMTAVYYYEDGYSYNRFTSNQTSWYRRHGGNLYYEVGPRLLLHASGWHERRRTAMETSATETWRWEVGADYRLEGVKTTVSIYAIHKEEKGLDPAGPVVEDLVILTITREI